MKKNSYCEACGFAQASHSALWLANSSDVLAIHMGWLRNAPFLRFFAAIGEHVINVASYALFHIGKAMGALTLGDDVSRARSDRSKFLWEEARRRSISMRQLILFGEPTDTFEISISGKRDFFQSIPVPQSLVTETIDMDDKVAFKKLMRAHDIPVPMSYSVRSLRKAKEALAELGRVCIKPQSGSNGRHTYPFVTTEQDLEVALRSAKQICAFASVEEHLEGNLCRATCVDGTMVGFLESYYPTVTGDGVSTVAMLVAKANEQKHEAVSDMVLTPEMERYIGRRGYARDSVLPEGTSLPLSYRAGRALGGGNRERGRAIHPSFIPLIEKAATLTKLPVVGFDIIIPNPLQSSESQRWGFVEANSLPWIDLHHTPLYGEPIDLSPAVWDLWKR